MHGDARVRFCDECKLHVYNLSSLTRAQAENLVATHEGRLCVRYYQRADGTIITQDCGGGLRRAMQRTRRMVTAAATAILCGVLSPFGFGSNISKWFKFEEIQQPAPQQREMQGKMAVMGDVAAPRPPREVRGEAVTMGVVAPLPPATQPTTAPSTQPAK